MKAKFLVVSLIVLLLAASTYAGDVNGKWKSKMTMQDGNVLELTFNFLAKADTLTGSVTSSYGEIKIYNGKITGDDFTFMIDVNGSPFTNVGKINGDKIKLSTKEMPMEMELTRAIETSKINGAWLGKVESPNGEMEITLTFKVEGDKLTGTNSSQMGEIPLLNGKVNSDEFTFDIEVGGNTISHKCKYMPNDTIDLKASIMGQEFPMILTRKK